MAMNTFDALMAEVNQKIAQANTAASEANASAAQAMEAAGSAREQAQAASAAASQASSSAQQANAAADVWAKAKAEAATGEAGSQASVKLGEEGGAKKLTFTIPRGANGATGAKGDTGRSGVTFTLSGSKLYITTG